MNQVHYSVDIDAKYKFAKYQHNTVQKECSCAMKK